MLLQKEEEDFVVATGRLETVRRFIEITANNLGWIKDSKDDTSMIWGGGAPEEIARRADTNEVVIRIVKRYLRPTKDKKLLGDSTRAFNNNKLNWKPKLSLEALIGEMFEVDIEKAKKEINLKLKKYRQT